MKTQMKVMREKGFTLVEMMIAVVLGLILIAGAMSVFLGAKQGYRMGQGMTLMQSTGRATMDFLSRELSMAGFPQSSGIESFIPDDVLLVGTADGGGNASDRVGVRYQTATDCLGNTTPAYADGLQYTKNVFFIQNGALMCGTLAEDNSILVPAQAVVQGVDNMQLLYGEDVTATDGVTNATTYVTAGNVTNWDNVVSVRLGLLVNSQGNIATTNDTVAYTLLGQTQIPAVSDRQRRRAYSSTIVVRNRTQGP